MSSQSEIVVTVKAGQTEMPVRAGGDFIFVKEAARNVRVIVDGQAINMGRGDKRRIERENPSKIAFSSFEISNLSEVDLRVVFVVGEGDYNSQIVTGELSVSESIKTTALTSINLPLKIEKELGLISAEKTLKTKNTVISETTGYGPFYAAYYYRGYVVGFGNNNNSNMHVFDSELNYVSDSLPVFEGVVGSWSIGDVCTNGRHVYITFLGNAIQGQRGIWRGTVLGGDFKIEKQETEFKNGLGIVGNVLYVGCGTIGWTGENANKLRIKKYTINSDGSLGGYSDLWIDTTLASYNSIEIIGDEIFVSTGANMSNYRVYSLDGVFLRVENISGAAGIFYLDKSKGVFYDRGNTIKRKAFTDLHYSCRLYVQDVGDVASRKEFDCLADVSIVPFGANNLMVGNIAAACMQAVSAQYQLLPDYLDYLVSLEYSDGDYTFLKTAGTATWAFRGLVDFGEMLLESKFSVELMPEYLSDAI